MGSREVNIFGWYGKQNVGDESYKISFPLLFPQYDWSFASKPTGRGITVLGGGDIVSPDNLAALRRCEGRKYLMSVTISADHKKADYDGIDGIWVRDAASLARVQSAGVHAEIVPDFAFALKPNVGNGMRLIRSKFRDEGCERYERIVTVVLNGHLSRNNTAFQAASIEKLAYDVARIADNTSASFLFLSFGTSAPNDDRVINAWSAQKAKWFQKNLVVHERVGVQDALDIIAASDAVMSMRLHSSIFAAVAGVPFIDITHNHKNPELLRTLKLEKWGMPLDSFDSMRCRDLLNGMLQGLDARKFVHDIGSKETQKLRQAISHVRLI